MGKADVEQHGAPQRYTGTKQGQRLCTAGLCSQTRRQSPGLHKHRQEIAVAGGRVGTTSQMTTGVYSNADLVANYEGYLFYRSLFEDDIIPGKPAILAWEDGGWTIQRPFTWADHVNEYWDEALNVNHFDALLYPHMKERLEQFCPDYFLEPHRYEIRDEEILRDRYAHIQLRDTSELRLDQLCFKQDGDHSVTGVAGRAQ